MFDANDDELYFNQASGFPRINLVNPSKSDLFIQMTTVLFLGGITISALRKSFRIAGRNFWINRVKMKRGKVYSGAWINRIKGEKIFSGMPGREMILMASKTDVPLQVIIPSIV